MEKIKQNISESSNLNFYNGPPVRHNIMLGRNTIMWKYNDKLFDPYILSKMTNERFVDTNKDKWWSDGQSEHIQPKHKTEQNLGKRKQAAQKR